MTKNELLKKLLKLKDEDYTNNYQINDGYRAAILDAIDLVEQL